MKPINKLTSEPFQRTFLTGNPGQRIVMDLRYNPTQQIWVADFTLGAFSVRGISVTASPNILRNYRNIIPFGIMVLTLDGQDPRGITDFQSEYCLMMLLSQEDVIFQEDNFYE